MPNHLAEKVDDAVINLSQVSTDTLKEWAEQATRWQDQDVIGCELMYRSK